VTEPVFLGIDIGTSGIRGSCITQQKREIAQHQITLVNEATEDGRHEQDATDWIAPLEAIITAIRQQLNEQINEQRYQLAAIAIDGTSASVIACRRDGTPLAKALMYNDQRADEEAQQIKTFAPAQSAVHGASSSLAKTLYLLQQHPETEIVCHQADWLAAHLTGRYGISDENNCLKLGYDSTKQCWPEWLQTWLKQHTEKTSLLPEVVSPGQSIGKLSKPFAERLNLPADCLVIAGTTDSNAAVLATGAGELGDAVTSLGSTLVIKVFSDKPLFDADYGIYSHRLNGCWLVGGASNSGGSVLLQHFSQQQLDDMTSQLTPENKTGLNYYPLPTSGERFPVNDVNKQNITSPRPATDEVFFQALLEGISAIEAEAYAKLQALGCTPVKQIFTAGGGSKNTAWTKIRQQTLALPVHKARHTQASFGSALLARQGYLNNSH